jgi:S1-C subfamily serine protease
MQLLGVYFVLFSFISSVLSLVHLVMDDATYRLANVKKWVVSTGLSISPFISEARCIVSSTGATAPRTRTLLPFKQSSSAAHKSWLPPIKDQESSEVVTRQASFIRDAVRRVGPSVVRIDCERIESGLLQMLMPESQKEAEVFRVSGSGFVLSSDGYLLTNAHVVSQSRKITVTFSTGRAFKGE